MRGDEIASGSFGKARRGAGPADRKPVESKARTRPTALFRLAATIFLSGAGGAAWSAAAAQSVEGSVMELGGIRLAVSPEEMRALSNLALLAPTTQRGSQDRALAEARRVANSPDARYALALYEFDIGRRRGDDAMRAQALDELISSRLTERDKLPGYLAARGQIAYRAGDFDMARRLWGRLAELMPSDPEVFANLAQVRLAQRDAAGAMDLLARAIAAREAAGHPASETWYRQRLSIAQQGNLVLPGIHAARALVSTHPTQANWRDALVVYRDLAPPQGAFEIDFLRLMHHVGALVRAEEYQRMAQLLRQSGEPREAKAVLNEGIIRGVLDPETSPTREIIAEVDRSVARVRSETAARAEQPNRAGAQVRLGRSLLLAGQRAEAEAAFRSAAGDPSGGSYADLAFFWLASLAQEQPAPAGRPSS
jgi:tetratricopeptide (TPR) repeat protein